MTISRRDLLKGAVVAGAAAAVPVTAAARHAVEPLPEAVGMLFDATLCVGCRACMTKCKESNELPYDRTPDGQYDAPADLNGNTKNLIKAFAQGDTQTYMKQQCMHCVDPSCVSVCMMGALHKEGEGKRLMKGERDIKSGIVIWDKDLCVGCRYCQIGCAFNVPRFEWNDALPKIVKCELCRHRAKPEATDEYALANPACCEACPRDAVIYGKRAALLEEAKRRVAAAPEKYNPKVFGETDGGGTQVLYLAPKEVEFTQLGLPTLPERSSAQFSESVSHAPYLLGITPIALYAGLAFIINRNHKDDGSGHGGEGK
jgi:Fe-S-cluster-containing dehydrogenase component